MARELCSTDEGTSNQLPEDTDLIIFLLSKIPIVVISIKVTILVSSPSRKVAIFTKRSRDDASPEEQNIYQVCKACMVSFKVVFSGSIADIPNC